MATQFYAHSSSSRNCDNWQILAEHLTAVADGASARGKEIDRFCGSSVIRFEKLGSIAGWLHDLGKYRSEFQDHLFGRPVERVKTYHKQAGAAKAAFLNFSPVAFAIGGHHGGIPDKPKLQSMISQPGGRNVMEAVWATASEENPHIAKLTSDPAPIKKSIDVEFASRIVLSCLVDADWEDTNRFKRKLAGLPEELKPPSLNAEELLERLMRFIGQRSKGCGNQALRDIRNSILNHCLDAAKLPVGIFKLTVPTGGGKTLSSLAFALQHAALQQPNLRRIIYVAPFLSILDQNTKVIRDALSIDDNEQILFAHHSLSEPIEDETDYEELGVMSSIRRAENWDSPIVVTTNVQFFESLFSNSPSRCRKLHNLAGSVILLDECQSIPPGLLAPILNMLKTLSEQLHCTIVMCTATQPSYSHPRLEAPSRIEPQEIILDPNDLFKQLSRVQIHWPSPDEFWDWKQVAHRMLESDSASPRALCIVNTRRAARELFEECKAISNSDIPIFHLSTSMCPKHRMQVLKDVHYRLKAKEPCLLISTQLIEAGVDVDFPMVLREMAPFESVTQAAGRCNREGLLTAEGKLVKGNVLVFRSTAHRDHPSRYYPNDSWYKSGRDTLETSFINAGLLPQIDQPDEIRNYFDRLYFAGDLDSKKVQQMRANLQFPEVAESVRLIEDSGEAVVVGSWETERQEVERLLKLVQRDPSRANFRKLIPYQINVRHHELRKYRGVEIVNAIEDLDLLVWLGPYHTELGVGASQEFDPLVY